MAIYKNTPPIITNGLVLNLDAANNKSYPGSGTTWTDLSGNSNNGTLTNGPTFSRDGGGSIVFNGVNNYVEINRNTNYDFNQDNSFTILGWFYISGVNTNTPYIGKWGNNSINTGSYILWTGGSALPRLIFSVANGGATAASTPALTYNLNTWNFFCGVYQSKTKLISYLNSNLNSEILYTGNINNPNTVNFRISRADFGSDAFAGRSSNISIYNRALSAQEVLQNYNALKSRFNLS
jgi:hypothetical protein